MSHRRRTRMISFRVSDDEFELLKTRSEAEGARSVSDFARLVLCGRMSSGTSGASGSTDEEVSQLTQLRDDVQQLNAHVRRVVELIESGRTPGRQRSPMLAVGSKSGEA